MRALRIVLALAPVLLMPAVALAQSAPDVYVCTPDGQVLKVTPAGATVIASGGGSFDDCVVGPNGKLYISDTTAPQIVSLDLPNGAASVVPVVGLSVVPRGLAFNITTLYINTAASGVWAFDINGGTSAAQVLSAATSGQGVVFDVPGNLVFSSDGTIQRSLANPAPPLYTSSSSIATYGAPQGVAVNTCRQTVVADKTTQSIYRVGTASALVKFAKKAFPTAIEIDAGNHFYFLTAEDDTGTNAILYRADPPATSGNEGLASSCGSVTLATLVDFKASLSGSNAIAGLLSSRAKGVAVGPSTVTISHTFAGECSFTYDFGFHSVGFTFKPLSGQTCGSASGESLSITSHKSRPADVTFTGAAFTQPTWGMRYSPMGGFVTEYELAPTSDPWPVQFQGKYGFFTQELVLTPGLARSNNIIGQPYDQISGTDFWDVGSLDESSGETTSDMSKRVVFNSGLSKTCRLDTTFEEPLNTGNPLFNSSQNSIKIAIGATDLNGNPCDGGTLFVSIVRIFSDHFEPQLVNCNNTADNTMDALGKGKYGCNLDATVLNTTGATKTKPAQFQITVWGNIAPPKNQLFKISK